MIKNVQRCPRLSVLVFDEAMEEVSRCAGRKPLLEVAEV
jgi:hypothetical protein